MKQYSGMHAVRHAIPRAITTHRGRTKHSCAVSVQRPELAAVQSECALAISHGMYAHLKHTAHSIIHQRITKHHFTIVDATSAPRAQNRLESTIAAPPVIARVHDARMVTPRPLALAPGVYVTPRAHA
eukprot:CAMPEP_0179689730 /NCGR_PEP_ID=MMETSP0936-20121108/3352_1 /TAXON_ID=548131 ORGANISM="Ostreococcus mediterraneus, Strain clade-D-RCC2573" /NCGR_SAMPLE_ID=MMETSP0936 /ASSEMBLY_ACC=CAM_ASM_000574 /LENGTH=127 /DNA_ID=CAMNT_0021562357 /DNA_START=1368 /DNA_END=1748 /DNA_ORIENTATION=+